MVSRRSLPACSMLLEARKNPNASAVISARAVNQKHTLPVIRRRGRCWQQTFRSAQSRPNNFTTSNYFFELLILTEPGEETCMFISREHLEGNSPSREHGVGARLEATFRWSYCEFLKDVGIELKMYGLQLENVLVEKLIHNCPSVPGRSWLSRQQWYYVTASTWNTRTELKKMIVLWEPHFNLFIQQKVFIWRSLVDCGNSLLVSGCQSWGDT